MKNVTARLMAVVSTECMTQKNWSSKWNEIYLIEMAVVKITLPKQIIYSGMLEVPDAAKYKKPDNAEENFQTNNVARNRLRLQWSRIYGMQNA